VRAPIALIGLLLSLVAVVEPATRADAQTVDYPSRPIKLIVPFPAGGSSDVLARSLAVKLEDDLKQPIVVDNRAGGNSIIGSQAAAASKPDGYTILQVTPGTIIAPRLQTDATLDPLRAFVPIIGVGATPLLLVVPAKSSIRSIGDLIALSKSRQGGVSYASGGVGSLGHLAPARFARELKMNATHVAYRGVNPALQDVIAGRVEFMFVSSLEGMQVAKSGRVRVLAVTSGQRIPALPDVPTMAELGFADFKPMVWYGFVAPAGTSPAILSRLYGAFVKATEEPRVREQLGSLGLTVQVSTGAEFGRYMQDESTRWNRVIQENRITAD
jgi:tripartite-type tricarboxylate transporter receptor subunit TctC